MLRDIHSWWARNLKDTTTASSVPPQQHSDSQLDLVQPRQVTFAVHTVTNEGIQPVCAKACLHANWAEPESLQLFVCQCQQRSSSTLGAAHPKVESIARESLLRCSPPMLSRRRVYALNAHKLTSPVSSLCFPFRQTGENGSWLLFKVLDRSTNQMVTIHISNVTASGK